MGQESKRCRDNCARDAIPLHYVDRRFDDFDAQSEQLTGHDQEYIQMSSGAFRGRFVSAFLGDGVSLHLESANRALAQRVGCPQELISLGLVVDGDQDFEANGTALGQDQVLITKPGRELSLNSPADGSILAICIDQATLGRAAADDIPRRLDPDIGGIEVFDAPRLAAQIRASATALLHVVRSATETDPPLQAAGPLVATIAAQFALQAAMEHPRGGAVGSESYRTFVETRDLMLTEAMTEFDYAALCSATRRSKRSIQLAFARHARTTPSHYFRAAKLADARRALLSDSGEEASIGDIAARRGFWSWSRFTQLYKTQFGELPSETRAHAAARRG